MNHHLFDIPLLVTSPRIGSLQNDRVCFTRGNGAREANRAGVLAGRRVRGALLRPETLEAPTHAALALSRQVCRLLLLHMSVSARTVRLRGAQRLSSIYRLRATQAGNDRKHFVRRRIKSMYATCISGGAGRFQKLMRRQRAAACSNLAGPGIPVPDGIPRGYTHRI